MRRFTIWDIIILTVTLGVVCVSLVPAVARIQRTPEDAKCQSNMRRLAEAMQMYTADNGGRYPTNRTKPQGIMTSLVALSPKGQYDENGNPVRFVNSINWVEALYPYLIDEAKKTGRDWESFLACPKASTIQYPPNSATARVTYVFNYSLLEQYPNLIRSSEKTMLIREMDRVMDSACRPYNQSYSSSIAPQSPFLTHYDFGMRSVSLNSKLHGTGSHVLFTDGHVKYFGSEFFPDKTTLTATESWDPETGQWWNWVNKSPELNKAIAITP